MFAAFTPFDVLMLQSLTVVVLAIFVGYLLGSQWSHSTHEPTTLRLTFSAVLIGIPLASVLPTVIPFWTWLVLAIVPLIAGAGIATLHVLVGGWLSRKQDTHWESGTLMVTFAALMIGFASLLNTFADFHLLKLVPLALILYVVQRAYQRGRERYGYGIEWYGALVINISVFAGIVTIVFML